MPLYEITNSNKRIKRQKLYNLSQMASKVDGKPRILIPVDLKPLKILLQKLDILIMKWGATSTPNFVGIEPGVSAPQIAEI